MTTHEIAENITWTFKGTGEFLMAIDLDTLAFEVVVDPSNNSTTGQGGHHCCQDLEGIA